MAETRRAKKNDGSFAHRWPALVLAAGKLSAQSRFNSSATMSDIKGPSPETKIDGSSLRVAIVHARWNKVIIDALVTGALTKLKEAGVKESNIVVESVPGSFELPLACSRYGISN